MNFATQLSYTALLPDSEVCADVTHTLRPHEILNNNSNPDSEREPGMHGSQAFISLKDLLSPAAGAELESEDYLSFSPCVCLSVLFAHRCFILKGF